MTKEQYEEANKYRGILELFNKTGEYVGGIGNLIQYLEPSTNTSCPSCMSAFLIRTYLDMLVYESNM